MCVFQEPLQLPPDGFVSPPKTAISFIFEKRIVLAMVKKKKKKFKVIIISNRIFSNNHKIVF